MSPRKAGVDRYFDGFRRSNHAEIPECLTDDVVWNLPGFNYPKGKNALDGARSRTKDLPAHRPSMLIE
jgi:ketosteroid isomerase-like protein